MSKPLPTRTKIIATLGPASWGRETLAALAGAGVDAFRINFSHGTDEEHRTIIRRVHEVAEELGEPLAVLADLQGPRIRLGAFVNGEPILLRTDDELTLVADPGLKGVPGRIGCSYRSLADEVQPGERMLLDDGNIELEVMDVAPPDVRTRVVVGGMLRQHKGVNLPGTEVRAPSLGAKDLADLALAVEEGVDFVALSFVRTAAEVEALRTHIAAAGGGGEVEVIAKIERREAVDNIDEIISASDGIMVARGDMGVELGPDAVPGIQKRIIRMCIQAAKPVITATQMLESMVATPRPTRAEASDVANAIYDGTSALMLSAETATGRYPLEAVSMMDRIARRTEDDLFAEGRHPARRLLEERRATGPRSIAAATVIAAAGAAVNVGATILVTFSETGRTARLLARERLPMRLITFTRHASVRRRLTLHWGVTALPLDADDLSGLHVAAERELLRLGLGEPGDRVVFIAGTMHVSGATNTMLVRELGSP
jgi:pyruvate kinase